MATRGAGSPANQQAQIPGFSNPGIPGANGQYMRGEPANRNPTQQELEKLAKEAKDLGGQLQHPQQGSHSLYDYQNQLMVLEAQNKKRLHAPREGNASRSDAPGNGGPFTGQLGGQAQGLQPGQHMQGTSMSPQNSRTGPSPQIANLELRKSGQKTSSGGASPEPENSQNSQIRGPSPAFPAGGMTQEQFNQMSMSQGYPQPL